MTKASRDTKVKRNKEVMLCAHCGWVVTGCGWLLAVDGYNLWLGFGMALEWLRLWGKDFETGRRKF